jgi:tetratricopeptide (TPR) repeat protein
LKILQLVIGGLVVTAMMASGCGKETAQALFDRGAEELKDGEYDQAILHFEKGLELEPGAAAGFNLLGMAYRMKYNTLRAAEWKEKEIDAFRQALAADSTYEAAHIQLGATLYYLGNKTEAAHHFRRALELNPDNPERDQLEQFIEEGGEEATDSGD